MATPAGLCTNGIATKNVGEQKGILDGNLVHRPPQRYRQRILCVPPLPLR